MFNCSYKYSKDSRKAETSHAPTFVDAARTFPTYSIWKLDAHCLNPGRKGQNPTNDASKASERGPGRKGDNLMDIYYRRSQNPARHNIP